MNSQDIRCILVMSEKEQFQLEAEVQRIANDSWSSEKNLWETVYRLVCLGASEVNFILDTLEPIAEFSDWAMMNIAEAADLAMTIVLSYGHDEEQILPTLQLLEEVSTRHIVDVTDLMQGIIVASRIAIRDEQPLPLIADRIAFDMRSKGLSSKKVVALYS